MLRTSFVSLVPMLVWLVLIARGLIRVDRPPEALAARTAPSP